MVAGIAALVLPGPGLLLLFGGLALLAERYEWAERRLHPVKEAALKTARDSVASTPRLIFSLMGVSWLIALGVFWGIGPDAPSWWPIHERFWLPGGWGAGASLIISGLIALGLLVYSHRKLR